MLLFEFVPNENIPQFKVILSQYFVSLNSNPSISLEKSNIFQEFALNIFLWNFSISSHSVLLANISWSLFPLKIGFQCLVVGIESLMQSVCAVLQAYNNIDVLLTVSFGMIFQTGVKTIFKRKMKDHKIWLFEMSPNY